jgi:pimeloyl-ACP methyl ester carboxylesterase
MWSKVRSVLVSSALLTAAASAVHAASADLVSIQTTRGAKQAFILITPSQKPVASVILFAGGDGALGLSGASSMNWGAQNFLVRTRNMFAARGLIVAVVDAPSDHKDGMNAVFRMSPGHARDIEAVAAHLKKQADVPVWLIGTSMGTFSAAGGAIAAKNVSGLVLTSTITRADSAWMIARSHRDGVASMALSQISVPTLIVSHRQDGCKLTPAADATKLKDRLTKAAKAEIALLDGGAAAVPDPCEGKSQHGFFGIEAQAVDTIAKFIKGQIQ